MKDFTLGLDLGQAQDYTAVVVVEQVRPSYRERDACWRNSAAGPPGPPPEPRPKPRYHLRHVERFDLGTPYPEQARRVAALIGREPLAGNVTVTADETGVGRAVVDVMKEEGVRPLVPVSITAGDKVNRDRGRYRVPKADLVATVQTLLQAERLKFAENLSLANVLTEELQKFRAKVTAKSGHVSFEHWRERDHDDVVLALALACWEPENTARAEVIFA
jgi:hypothetical protein